eukprot:Gb_40585 [translate_table: standard]
MIQWLSSNHLWSSTVHFESSYCGHNNSTLGLQTTVSALYIHELLCTNISTKTCLSYNKSFMAHELQGNLVCYNGRVSMSDIGKGASMNKHCCALKSLHQCGIDRIFHEHS